VPRGLRRGLDGNRVRDGGAELGEFIGVGVGLLLGAGTEVRARTWAAVLAAVTPLGARVRWSRARPARSGRHGWPVALGQPRASRNGLAHRD